MTHCGIPFAEECIRLRQPESKAAILRHSPSGKVPALKMKGLVVCDSLAVLEFLAERHPEHQLWPSDPEARAIARSISAEMHSGFVTLRNEMSMDSAQPLPCSSDRGRARSRHSPCRGDLARHARDTVVPDHSCSAHSPMPTRCTRRSRRACAPMAWSLRPSAMTALLQLMPGQSLPCRRWRSGRRPNRRSRRG